MNLFTQLEDMNKQVPLAELMRPKTLEEFLGQSNVVAPNSPLLKLARIDSISSQVYFLIVSIPIEVNTSSASW